MPPVEPAMTDEAATTTPSENSPELSADGVVLRAPDGTPTALRLSTATMLVRDDLPAELTGVRRTLEQVLVMQGLRLLDQRSVLAGPAAGRLVDLPGSTWDLWGSDLAISVADLGSAALPAAPPAVSAAPAVLAAPAVPAPAAPAGPAATVSLDKAPSDTPPLPRPSDEPGALPARAPTPLYRRGAFRVLAAATAVVIAGLIVLFVAVLPDTNNASKVLNGSAPSPSTTASPGSAALPVGKFVDYHDPQGRFSLSYPASWKQLTVPAAAELVISDGGNDALAVHVYPTLGVSITSDNISHIQELTTAFLPQNVRVLGQRALTLNGMPAYYYFYTFTDQPSGQQGANGNYFVFNGARMVSLIVQALPDTNFAKLTNIFDKIAGSLHVTPAKPKPQDATPTPGASPAKSG